MDGDTEVEEEVEVAEAFDLTLRELLLLGATFPPKLALLEELLALREELVALKATRWLLPDFPDLPDLQDLRDFWELLFSDLPPLLLTEWLILLLDDLPSMAIFVLEGGIGRLLAHFLTDFSLPPSFLTTLFLSDMDFQVDGDEGTET